MQIGEPEVKQFVRTGRRSEWALIWRKIDSMNFGEALPVTCDSKGEVERLRVCVFGQRYKNWKAETHSEGLTLWIRKVEKNGR